MSKQKLFFAFDMDGTIVSNKSKLLPATAEALKKLRAKGHIVAIVTGRPFKDIVRDIPEELIDVIIPNNGSYYYLTSDKKFVYKGDVPFEITEEMIKLGVANKCFFAIHGETEAVRCALQTGEVDWDSVEFEEFKKFKDQMLTLEETIKFAKEQKVQQVSLRGTEEVIASLKPHFDTHSEIVEAKIANLVYLDINSVGISKLTGIEDVLPLFDLTSEDVIAFGDSGNDLEMLNGAAIGICMGNGTDGAKAVADEIIGTNNQPSIADRLKEYL